MTVNRFGGTFKTRTDILDNITPNNVVQSNVSAPAGEWKPADWLPTEWETEAGKDFFVISSGKVVCFTADGRIAPAGFRRIAEDVRATNIGLDVTILSYTQNDVDAGVIDLTTGEAVAAAVDYDATDVAEGLLARGLVEAGEAVAANGQQAMGNADDFDANDENEVGGVLVAFFSEPIGVCAYDVFKYSGQPQDGDMTHVNYSKQHLVQFLTDVQMQVPHMLANDTNTTVAQRVTSGDLNAATAYDPGNANHGLHFPSALIANTELALTAAQLAALARYTGKVEATDPVVAIALVGADAGIAQHTRRSPVENTAGDVLVRRRSSAKKIRQAGDWYLDSDAGLLFLHAADGATNPAEAGDTVSYGTYAGVGGTLTTVANNHRFTHFCGAAKPGDRVTFDRRANLVVAAADEDEGKIVGRVLQVIKQPKGMLDRVRTAWEGGSFDKTAQMPGTATEGFTDLLTLSDDGTSDEVVIVNIKAR